VEIEIKDKFSEGKLMKRLFGDPFLINTWLRGVKN